MPAQKRLSRGIYQSTDVASAATCDIGNVTTLKVNITGSVTITSFGTTKNCWRFGRFAGVLTLTNGANLVLPGGANITTAAGDTFAAFSDGASTPKWTVWSYQRADGTAVSDPEIDPVHLGAVADGTTNDAAALTAALTASSATGFPVNCHDRTYGVSGWLQPGNNWTLKNAKINQLAHSTPAYPTAGNGARTIYASSRSGFRIENVRINLGTDPDSGTITDYAGVWLNGCSNFTLDRVEVTGDGRGTGIRVIGCSNFKVIDPYLHDLRFHASSDPGAEQIVGLWFDTCTDFSVWNTRAINVTASFGAGSYLPQQTDGVDFNGCSRFNVFGGRLQNCHEGIDLTGATNSDWQIFGLIAYQCVAGIKAAHTQIRGRFVDCLAVDCSTWGFMVSGGVVASSEPAPYDIEWNGCRAINPGKANFDGNASVASGWWVASGGAGVTNDGTKFRLNNCSAIDDQGTHTMAYAIRNEGTVALEIDRWYAVGWLTAQFTGTAPVQVLDQADGTNDDTPANTKFVQRAITLLKAAANTWALQQTFTVAATFNTGLNIAAAQFATWAGRSRIGSSADGMIELVNNAANDFTRLNFGGTTSSFPALKRSSTELQVRLANDGGPAPFRCGFITKAGAFSTSDIASGEVVVGYDSSGGTRKLYMNQGGTLYSVALT